MKTLARQERPPALGRSLVKLAKEGRSLIRLFQIESMVDGLPEGQSADGRVSVDTSETGREVQVSVQSGKPHPSFDTKTTMIQMNSAGQVTHIHQSVAYADDMGIKTHTNEYAYSAYAPRSALPQEVGALSLREVAKDIRYAQSQVAS
jgi:hypothetical protein